MKNIESNQLASVSGGGIGWSIPIKKLPIIIHKGVPEDVRLKFYTFSGLKGLVGGALATWGLFKAKDAVDAMPASRPPWLQGQ